jgi:hypothetical protein
VVLLVAVKLTGALVAVTVKAWLDGTRVPAWMLKVGRGLGETVRKPFPVVVPTFNVTETVKGLPVCGAMRMLPAYELVVRLVGFAVTVMEAGVPGFTLVKLGETLSHAPPLVVLDVIVTEVPIPVFVSVSVCMTAVLPTGTPLKTTGFGDALIAEVPPPVPVTFRVAVTCAWPELVLKVMMAVYVPTGKGFAEDFTEALITAGALPTSALEPDGW